MLPFTRWHFSQEFLLPTLQATQFAQFMSSRVLVFCGNNWWSQFCWPASTIHVGLHYYFLTYCFSLGTQAQPELGSTQEWFFLFRLIWMTSTSKQMKGHISEGWGLGGGRFGVFCPLVTTHHHMGNRELGFWEKQSMWQRTEYEREAGILSPSLQHSGSIRMPDTHTDGFQALWDAIHYDQCDNPLTVTLKLLASSHRNCPINPST